MTQLSFVQSIQRHRKLPKLASVGLVIEPNSRDTKRVISFPIPERFANAKRTIEINRQYTLSEAANITGLELNYLVSLTKGFSNQGAFFSSNQQLS